MQVSDNGCKTALLEVPDQGRTPDAGPAARLDALEWTIKKENWSQKVRLPGFARFLPGLARKSEIPTSAKWIELIPLYTR